MDVRQHQHARALFPVIHQASADKAAEEVAERLQLARMHAGRGGFLWAPYDQPHPLSYDDELRRRLRRKKLGGDVHSNPQGSFRIRKLASGRDPKCDGDRTLYPCLHTNPFRLQFRRQDLQ